ncbi:DUF4142 domain-containing protein [Hymenobacter jejuensis]|uniref:DUF4142 domain-containing protein n=1 Tax=Hymenobacter jejuensis TaxID=2502781 RepID=A0A5B7ZZM1_9BACT|nr:DUF4142 domain-containing protein [Hymenobacter jejuensis]QDA59923.1 DUF4142 domain-containing protein [Hymenobacter jejuensis]
MRLARHVVPVVVLLLAANACSPDASKKDPVAEAKFQNEKRIRDEAITDKQEHDAEFMVTTASSGMLETELAKLAQQKAATPGLKTFSQQLLTQHNELSGALQALASRKGIVLPTGMSEDQQSQYRDAAGLTGTQFDKKVMDLLVSAHEKDVDAFDDMSDDAYDGDIRGFAAKYLPTLKDHLNQAKELKDQVEKLP